MENEFICRGIINKFDIQFELGWKVLKELLKHEGRKEAASGSPREILKTAYAVFGFLDEDVWLSMLRERNNTAHMYSAEAARELVRHILETYIPAFARLRDALRENYGNRLKEREEPK